MLLERFTIKWLLLGSVCGLQLRQNKVDERPSTLQPTLTGDNSDDRGSDFLASYLFDLYRVCKYALLYPTPVTYPRKSPR